MNDRAPRLFVLGSYVNACCAEVERLPRPGESLHAGRVTSEPGGKGFNVAVGARRLGADVECLAAVGDDLFGQAAEQAFVAGGLSTALLRRYATATGAGIGFVQANGENCVAVFPGANLCLSGEDVRAVALSVETAAMVIAQFEIADAPILEAFRIARRAARPTLLNPSPFRMPSREMLAETTILVANEREAMALAQATGLVIDAIDQASVERLARQLQARGPELLVVTIGARGAIACGKNGETIHRPAFAVEAVDTLGAGDAFTAALGVGLAAGSSLEHALTRAAAAGAVMASRAGTFAALPTNGDIDHLLRESESTSSH